MLDRNFFARLDDQDPLGHLVSRFRLPPGLVYLDGNSLGPLPAHVPEAVGRVIERQWGQHLIAAWNDDGWWDLPRRVGERIARLIGAPEGTVVVSDTTTVSFYKAIHAARRLRPDRPVILTDAGNFPTDLYVLASLADRTGARLEVVEPADVAARLADDVAMVALTHVDYRTGRRHPMAELEDAAEQVGAFTVWDLSHSVGAMELDVSRADMAVGCGYKYLNGGPGAPAFLYVNRRHHDMFENPIPGWWGHAEPFAMETSFRAAPGIARAQIGTPPIISLAALDAALDVFDDVDMVALRRKSETLTGYFLELVDARLEGFRVVTPREPDGRGSQVTLAHPEADRIMEALRDRGVVGDIRPPDLLRFGVAPAYQRYLDVWYAVETIRTVMESAEWREAPPQRGPVT